MAIYSSTFVNLSRVGCVGGTERHPLCEDNQANQGHLRSQGCPVSSSSTTHPKSFSSPPPWTALHMLHWYAQIPAELDD